MIGWRDEAGTLRRGSLFGAFAALARGEAWSFPALRPHQREAWHAFTVQVAAMALIRAGRGTLPEDEAEWRELLVALSDGVAEAWELVVDDRSKPALLQPPVTNLAGYKVVETPDLIDMILTAKNNDVKRERLAHGSDEEWLFALVTLQTAEGDRGICPPDSRYFGVSRMNKGFGSRMSLSVRPMDGAGSAFKRDVTCLVADGSRRTDRRGGKRLLWLEPWDGTVSESFVELDELYVEICRRVRLERSTRGTFAWSAASRVPKIAASALKGNTGDPWAPLKAGTSESITVSKRGLGYREMSNLLNKQKTSHPLLAKIYPDDRLEGLRIVAAAFARGQGKTEGLHRRTIRTSDVLELENGDRDVLDRIGDVAQVRAKEAGDANRRLRHALIILMSGGREREDRVRARDGDAEEWTSSLRLFDFAVDREFFNRLFWDEVDTPTYTKHRRDWRSRLRTIAEGVLAEAIKAAPRTAMRRDEAAARAENRLAWDMDNWFKEVAGDG